MSIYIPNRDYNNGILNALKKHLSSKYTITDKIAEDTAAAIIPTGTVILASIEDASDEQWEAAFDGGAAVSMRATIDAGEHFKSSGIRGTIIYLGSIHAEKPTGGAFLYSIQCSAAQMMCREAAIAYGEYGVNAVYIQCGITESGAGVIGGKSISSIYSATAQKYPLKVMPTDDSLCAFVDFLLENHDGAALLNGSDIRADGGLTMYYGTRGD